METDVGDDDEREPMSEVPTAPPSPQTDDDILQSAHDEYSFDGGEELDHQFCVIPENIISNGNRKDGITCSPKRNEILASPLVYNNNNGTANVDVNGAEVELPETGIESTRSRIPRDVSRPELESPTKVKNSLPANTTPLSQQHYKRTPMKESYYAQSKRQEEENTGLKMRDTSDTYKSPEEKENFNKSTSQTSEKNGEGRFSQTPTRLNDDEEDDEEELRNMTPNERQNTGERRVTANDKVLESLFVKLRKGIVSDVGKIVRRVSINNNSTLETDGTLLGDNNGFPMPSSAEPDGKVTLSNGLRVEFESFLKAVDAPTMMKRAKALANGVWTSEERLRLTLDNKKSKNCKIITQTECGKLLDACGLLQQHERLDWDVEKQSERMKLLRRWISAKLKSEKYRKTPKYTATRNKKKKSSLGKKNEAVEKSTRENDNEIETMDTPGTEKIEITNKLLRILSSSMYQGLTSVEENNELPMYSWKEIRAETGIKNSKLREILGEDCCVVINGKVRLVDADFEFAALMEMTEISREFFGFKNSMQKEKMMEILEDKFQTEFVHYMFDKYAVPVSEARQNANQHLYRWDLRVLLHSRAYHLIEAEPSWNYQLLVSQLKRSPYCDIEIPHDTLFEAYGTVDRTAGDEPKLWTVQKNGKKFYLDPVSIVTDNINKAL